MIYIQKFYFFILNPLEKGDEVTVFDTMIIDPMLSNTDMLELAELRITVQAFAVQQFGFDDCFSAMNGAFEDHFGPFGE